MSAKRNVEQFWGIKEMSLSMYMRRVTRHAPLKKGVSKEAFTGQLKKITGKKDEATASVVDEEEQNPLVTQRQSMISTKEVEDMELEDMEEEENGVNVFRKRRGSIFGNNSDTIFGN